jgi:hypothetical protein
MENLMSNLESTVKLREFFTKFNQVDPNDPRNLNLKEISRKLNGLLQGHYFSVKRHYSTLQLTVNCSFLLFPFSERTSPTGLDGGN